MRVGPTRLKSGTSEKLVLYTSSTLGMAGTDRTYGNLMVGLIRVHGSAAGAIENGIKEFS